MLLATGCIVADPPEYLDPVQTRPVLDIGQAVPGTSQMLVVHTGDKQSFSVPVRSEDAGEDLRAVFFVDQGPGSPGAFQNSQTIPASTYNETAPRAITYDWPVPRMDPGCHLLTLTVAHGHSFDPNHNDVLRTDTTGAAKDDAAIVIWWLSVPPDATTPDSQLVKCPTMGVVAQ